VLPLTVGSFIDAIKKIKKSNEIANEDIPKKTIRAIIIALTTFSV